MQGPTKRQRQSSFFLDLPKSLLVWFFKTYCDPCIALMVWLAHADPLIENVTNAQRAMFTAARFNYVDYVELIHAKWKGRQTLFTLEDVAFEAIKADALHTILFLSKRCSGFSKDVIVQHACKEGALHILDYYREKHVEMYESIMESGNLKTIEWYLQHSNYRYHNVLQSIVMRDFVHILKHYEREATPWFDELLHVALRTGALKCLDWLFNVMKVPPSNLDLLGIASVYPSNSHSIQWLTMRDIRAPIHLIDPAGFATVKELFECGCELDYQFYAEKWPMHSFEQNTERRWLEKQILRADVERVGDILRKIN
jgi:hypothetical protein